ncbi:MAG TPA: sulfatase-like hydrolase/transferase [Gammaproteobacteria bacterium]|nr:sulfatase-like hydrolase/transferase [Gammaproteobacteria bacterium]
MARERISRKDFLKQAGLGLGGLALGSTLLGRKAARAQSSSRPNILFVCMDQLRSWLDIPEALPLPTFRRLLREGRGFRNYHVHQAPCGPSRATFYTGQHVQKTGMYTNPPGEFAEWSESAPRGVHLEPGFPTIGTMLREQGYYTAYKGKWHLSVVNQKVGAGKFPDSTKLLEEYGFSDYNYDGEHTGLTWAGFGHDGVITAESINLLERFSKGYAQGKPWFLAVNLINPHDIMFFDSEGDGGGLAGTPTLGAPGTPLYEKDWGFDLPKSYYKDDLSTKPAVQRPFSRMDAAQLKVYQNYYFNCIRDVDTHLGALLDALDRLDLARNTVVVTTADHGERGGAHGGMIGKGADIYKETVRVPLIVRHPDVRSGGLTDALAGSVDLVPTLLGFAGLDDAARAARYPSLHGVDLRPAIASARGRTARDERGILFNYTTPGGGLTADGPATTGPGSQVRGVIRGVYDGRYKFGRYFKISEHHEPRDWDTLVAHNDLELYDTSNDPDEIVNLAFDKPEAQKAKILELNAKVNALVDGEVGADDGAMYPGETSRYVLSL